MEGGGREIFSRCLPLIPPPKKGKPGGGGADLPPSSNYMRYAISAWTWSAEIYWLLVYGHNILFKKFEIYAMRKNRWLYIYLCLGGVENGHMVGVGWPLVLHLHYAQLCTMCVFCVLAVCLLRACSLCARCVLAVCSPRARCVLAAHKGSVDLLEVMRSL